MPTQRQQLPWLIPGQSFPDPADAWDENSPAPGLLAAGGALDIETLKRAYGAGIFPWYGEGQPTLWWSPNPRMVLNTSDFRLHASLKKTLTKFYRAENCEIRMDSAFRLVIEACATSVRDGQTGTWIFPEMIAAYCDLHQAGVAHSVETWIDGKLMGGLYCIGLGRSVFGESMFSRESDASKIALAALVSFCRHYKIAQIDCQQNTRHLASLGAREITRSQFIENMTRALSEPAPVWQFDPYYWEETLDSRPIPT